MQRVCTAWCAAALLSCGSSSLPTPEGAHHGYVVSSLSVPANDLQVREFGLDLGSSTSSKLDGRIDNTLGSVFSALTALNFDVQGPISAAVDRGSILLLIDFQTEDFTNASAVGFAIELGANPVPPACEGAADPTCRHHLTGTASFSVGPDSPASTGVAGTIASGAFDGGPGELTLQLATAISDAPIHLNLLRARVQASSISATGVMTATVGGVVTETELTTEVGPAIQAQVASVLGRDCTGVATPPACGCPDATEGKRLISTLDTNHDCTVATDEILGFSVLKTLLQPDSCSEGSCATADSLSLGVQIQAVPATFPM